MSDFDDFDPAAELAAMRELADKIEATWLELNAALSLPNQYAAINKAFPLLQELRGVLA